MTLNSTLMTVNSPIPVVAQVHQENTDSDNSIPSEVDSPVIEMSDAENSFDISLSRLKPEPLMVIPVQVRGRSVDALIDTGATVSLIRCEVLGTATVFNTSTPHTIQGLGSSQIKSSRKIQLPVSLGSVVLEVNLLVVGNSDIKHDLILGVDFLHDYGLSVDFGLEKVTGALKDGSFEVYFTEDSIKTVYQNLPVYSLERFTAKKGEAELVSAYIEGVPPETIQGQEFFYEAQTVPFSLPLLIHEGVVVHDGQKIQLLIEKCYDAQRNSQETFKKGTYLGRVSTIVETEVNVLENMGDSARMDEDILQQVDLSHLPLSDSSAVRKMLSKCAVVLSRGDADSGCAGVTEHRIELQDTTPIRQKPRRFPDPVAQEIENNAKS